MRECFEPKNFRQERQGIIQLADLYMREYARQGYDLTLRQLYYQFISRDSLPESWADPVSGSKNLEKNYKKLGDIIKDGRMAGLLDWAHMVDRTRGVYRVNMWEAVEDVLRASGNQFKFDPWEKQENYVEVWIEKEALVGVISGVCSRHRVRHLACKGSMSASAMYAAANRYKDAEEAGKTCHLFHLGDHDPSGVDMTRDNSDRLDTMLALVDMERLALNMGQINQYQPPPNPVKAQDTNSPKYIRRYGHDCWELDALEPAVINQVIEDGLSQLIDKQKWDDVLAEEEEEKQALLGAARHWREVADFVADLETDERS